MLAAEAAAARGMEGGRRGDHSSSKSKFELEHRIAREKGIAGREPQMIRDRS